MPWGGPVDLLWPESAAVKRRNAQYYPLCRRRPRMERPRLLRRQANQHSKHRQDGRRGHTFHQRLRRGLELLAQPREHHHRTVSTHKWGDRPNPRAQTIDALAVQGNAARRARRARLQHRLRGQVARRALFSHELVWISRAFERRPAEGFPDKVVGQSAQVHRGKQGQRVLPRAELHRYPQGRLRRFQLRGRISGRSGKDHRARILCAARLAGDTDRGGQVL